MEQEITLHIVLQKPPPGVDFGIQKGSGSKYDTVQKQRSASNDLHFEFTVAVRKSKDSSPGFYGPFVQGTPADRFVYIDIGTFAGQAGTFWSRRLKIPLKGITWEMINNSAAGSIIGTHIPGTGKDGGPTCGTIKPFDGWSIISHT